MLCLQQVKRLTLEGSSFKVPGNTWLFQFVMKKESRCSKNQNKKFELNVGEHHEPVEMGCGISCLFLCIMMTWSLLQELESLRSSHGLTT